jgi:hypothetical protein
MKLSEVQQGLNDRKLMKAVAKEAPLTYRAFFGRRYLLPSYRQADYTSQHFENWIGFDRLCTYAAGAAPRSDEPWMICLSNTVASLAYNRPTLFLERELGEALLRTDVLENLTTGDIHWRWPAFRIYLPARLVTIHRQGDPESRWATYFDLTTVSPEGHGCLLPIAREIDQFVADNVTQSSGRNLGLLQRARFQYKEAGMAIGTALNKSDHPDIVQTIYAQLKPWGSISVTKYLQIADDLKGGYSQDEADRRFLGKLQHLVLNVLLFLSSQPDDIEPPEVLRPGNFSPKKMQGELIKARFVGQARARMVGEPPKPRPIQPTGRHLPAHWVSGHWRRVVYGPARSGRRLQWIQPYQTTEDVLSSPEK